MYYTSYITEYPIYEPAEGGYYYAGETVQYCIPCSSWKKVNRIFNRWKKEFVEEYMYEDGKIIDIISGGVGKYINPAMVFNSRLIGDGARIEITKTKPKNRGWRPYC